MIDTWGTPLPNRPGRRRYFCSGRWYSAGLWPHLLKFVVLLMLCAGDAAVCRASAYFVREQSTTAMANAFAGATADAADLTYMFFNGAALGRQQGSAVAVVSSAIRSSAKFRHGEASTLTGAPVTGGSGGDGGGTWLIPALYGVWDLSASLDWRQPVRLGLAINAPFGFETDYQDGWIGRYYALHSRLQSLAVNPVIAWTPSPGVSLAAGLQMQRIDAKLTNAIDFGGLGAANGVPGAVPGTQDGFGKLVGDDWGFGWTLGLLAEPRPGTRFGVSWRSAVHHDISGDGRVRLDSDGIGAALGQSGGTTAAKAKFTTPDIVAFGAYQQLDDDWAVMFDAGWTRWSRNRVLRVRFDNGQPDDVTEQDWRDTWFLAGGTSLRLDEAWTISCGLGWDQSPTRNRTREPRTPANSGLLLAAGARWQVSPSLGLSVAFSHFFIESARIDLQDDAPGNTTRGNLSGASDNAVDSLSMQFVWRF